MGRVQVETGKRLRVAIIGSGNIGTDLLYKVRQSKHLKCTLMVGRRIDSPGLERARKMGIQTSPDGLEGLKANIANIDLVFDATSASEHILIADALQNKKVALINLTPAPLGRFFIPFVTNDPEIIHENAHLNMVTCGGQTSIPLLHILASALSIKSVEIVSTIASNSAGLATRENLDEYIANTERAIGEETDIQDVKVMLVINPAIPEIVMHTSIYISGSDLVEKNARDLVNERINEMNEKGPNIKLIASPSFINENTIHFAVEVSGSGDYLPTYSGNLDIINVAAIQAAETISQTMAR
jgi:acetaldehyde dehydrogenase (acetylating)